MTFGWFAERFHRTDPLKGLVHYLNPAAAQVQDDEAVRAMLNSLAE